MRGSGRCSVVVSVCSNDGRLVINALCSERDTERDRAGRQQADCQGRSSTGGVLRNGMDLV